MTLSRKAKEAIKTGLAMTITYGIALSLNWEKPVWAGFAVAFVSLATIGQSFNKAAMRLFGSVVAGIVALVIFSLFIQDRWMFMAVLSGYVGFCSYMMGGSKNQYFWNVCGFVCVIICMGAGPSSIEAFQLTVLRVQETGLGILVYSIVALLLWPTHSLFKFRATRKNLHLSQQQLIHSLLMVTEGEMEEYASVKTKIASIHTQFSALLGAAIRDDSGVRSLEK